MQDAVYWVVPLVLKHKPKAVVLYEGDNDIGMYNSTPEKVRDGFVEFVSKVQAELPETTVYFLAIKPSIARWHLWSRMREANDLIRTVCEKGRNLHYIDIATPMLNERGEARAELFVADKLHMNEGGYALWTGIVKPALAEGVVNTK
jgi:lysophospholipase L1-like esterase